MQYKGFTPTRTEGTREKTSATGDLNSIQKRKDSRGTTNVVPYYRNHRVKGSERKGKERRTLSKQKTNARASQKLRDGGAEQDGGGIGDLDFFWSQEFS